MPLIIPKIFPAYDELQKENVFIMHQERAMSCSHSAAAHPDFKPDADKIVTETQLARLFWPTAFAGAGHVLQTATHSTTHTAPEHMKAFYKTFDEIKK